MFPLEIWHLVQEWLPLDGQVRSRLFWPRDVERVISRSQLTFLLVVYGTTESLDYFHSQLQIQLLDIPRLTPLDPDRDGPRWVRERYPFLGVHEIWGFRYCLTRGDLEGIQWFHQYFGLPMLIHNNGIINTFYQAVRAGSLPLMQLLLDSCDSIQLERVWSEIILDCLAENHPEMAELVEPACGHRVRDLVDTEYLINSMLTKNAAQSLEWCWQKGVLPRAAPPGNPVAAAVKLGMVEAVEWWTQHYPTRHKDALVEFAAQARLISAFLLSIEEPVG